MSVILITGTSSGFGHLTVQTLARRGHQVFAGMREVGGRNVAAAEDLTALARTEGWTVHVVPLDTSDETSTASAVAAVVEAAGRLDVLVNNVGLGAWGIAEGYTPEQVLHLFETNVFSTVRMNHAVLPQMRAQRSGLLVHVSAAVGRFVMPFMVNYSAAKHAVEALAEGYRYELAPFGIDSVIIEPGAYLTRGSRETILRPQDTDRVAAYGELAIFAEGMYQQTAQAQDRGEAADASEVAALIADVIEQSAGTRPLRSPIGSAPAPMLAPINELTDQIQTQALQYMGLPHLTHLAGVAASSSTDATDGAPTQTLPRPVRPLPSAADPGVR